MRIPIEQLPQPILARLKAIQTNPAAYDCFYRRQGGRGLAIFGLIVAGLAAPALLALAFNEYIPLPVGIVAGLLLGAMVWGSVSRIRRFGRAAVKPMVFVNPLYFARVTLDHVTFYSLWSEIRDLRITHHHTNGVYTFTNFEFFFKRGAKEALAVSPRKLAEQLISLIDEYRVRMVQAIENQQMEQILSHDLFVEARVPDDQGRPPRFRGNKRQVRRRWLLAWGLGGAVGALAGFAISAVSYVNVQSRMIDHCYSIRGCEAYFGAEWVVPLFTERARAKLSEVYKQEWERDRKSVRRLREMAKLDKVPFVTPAQEKEILAFYRDGSRKELRARYQQAIDKYKSVSSDADPKARASLIRMLELARDRGYYRVKVSYRGFTEKIQQPLHLKQAVGKSVVPMAPSFTDALNKSREALITERIHRAFLDIVPQDVLEFPGLPTPYGTYGSGRYGTYGSGRYGSRYGSGRYGSGRYGARARPAAAEKGAEPAQDESAELEFKVAYVVFPSGSIYVSRRDPSKLYVGIGFDWLVSIHVKEEKVYAMRQQSFPPPKFTVTSYGSRYAPPTLGAGAVYAKMATTAFDDFSKNIVKHFGIPVTERRTGRGRSLSMRGFGNR